MNGYLCVSAFNFVILCSSLAAIDLKNNKVKMKIKILPVSIVYSLFSCVVPASEVKPLDCMVKPEMYVELSSPVDGVLESLTVANGDAITKGQVLAKLEASVDIAKVNLARQETMNDYVIESKKVELDFTERNKKRYQDMYVKESIAYYEEDRAKTDAALARLAVEKSIADKKTAQLQLQLALAQLEQKTIKSPINGIIVDRYVMPGESVNGRSIMKLAQINPLRVELIAPAEMFGQITKGLTAEIQPEKPANKTYKATVTSVDQLIDPASGTFTVRMALPNPDDKIIAGVNCTAKFNFAGWSLFSTKPVETFSKIEPPIPVAKVDQNPLLTPTVTASPIAAPNYIKPAQEVLKPAPAEPAQASITAEPGSILNPVQSQNMDFLNRQLAQPKAAPPVKTDVLPPRENTLTPDEFAKIVKNLNEYSQTVVQHQTQAVSTASVCFDLGPFPNSSVLKKLTKGFSSSTKSFQVMSKELQTISGYQVLYPAAPTIGQSMANEAFLKKKGIKDFVLLLKGPSRGAISLGIAPNEIKAKSFAGELNRKGISTEIQPRYKSQLSYFAHFSIPNTQLAELDKFITPAKQQIPELNLQQLPACNP